MADQVALRTFDYDELALEDREHVRLQAARICVLTRQAAKDIIAVGEILTDVKARLDHGQFEAWLKTEFSWGRTTAWRFMRVYEHFKGSNLEDLPIAPSALYLLAEPGTPEAARTVVIQRAQEGEAISHAEAQRLIVSYKTDEMKEPERLMVRVRPADTPDRTEGSKHAVHFSSASAEWYTPDHIVQRVMEVLGDIDLDPCADPDRTIPAVAHFTAEDDGLSREWHGRVYMNPPYGREIERWVTKLRREFEADHVSEAIALVPARTDTDWWGVLADYPVCFIDGRLHFSDHPNGATFPSALVYLGPDKQRFLATVQDIGYVYLPAGRAA